MTKWTKEMHETINELMNAECGGDWWETKLTKQILDNCCAKCPFAARCRAEGLCYGCSVWMESWVRACEIRP